MNLSMSESVSCVKMNGQFDENLNHISSNFAMQNFLGDNLMHSLYRIVHSGDAEKLEKALQRSKSGNECMEIVRLLGTNDCFSNFILKIRYNIDQIYCIDMLNADENNAIIDKLNRDICSLRAYLTLENDILLNYNAKTKLIRIFVVSEKMDVTLYEMRIDTWQEQMISNGYITDQQDINIFTKMCKDIKDNNPKNCYEFKSKIIRKGEKVDYNRIKIHSINNDNNDVEIVGRWMIIDESTDESIDDFCVNTYIDPLTELLNKKSITEYAKDTVNVETNERVGFAMMDLDNFKAVNDTYGHLYGDEVLKTVGKIIKDAISGIAVAGRMGGDEFFIVFKDYMDELHMRNVLRTIKINIASYFRDKLGDIQLSCSIGASRSDLDSNDYSRLFKIADKALYIAKQKGRNRYIIYKTHLHGEFCSDDSQAQVEMKSNYYDEEDMRGVSRWIKKVIVNGKSEISAMLEYMANAFHFDRVGIYLDNGIRTEYEYRKSGVVPGNGAMIQMNSYLDMFSNDILVVENVNTIEYSVSEAYELMMSTDTKSMIQILIRDLNEEIIGVISFDTCSRFVTYPSKVVESIKTYGSILAGIMI